MRSALRSVWSEKRVAESDFTENLSSVILEEDSAQKEYDEIKEENALTSVSKEQDVKYKT